MVSPKLLGLLLALAAASAAAAAPLGEKIFQRNFFFHGLGPMYDASSCAACHAQGAEIVGAGENGVPMGTVIRLSSGQGEGDPVYGVQLQTRALAGVPAEAKAD